MNNDTSTGTESAIGVSRRTFLAGVGVGVAGVGISGSSGVVSAQDDDPSLEEWMDDVPNYDGVVDYRDEDGDVRVTVGADDGFTYEPAAIRIDPGTTVVWEWTGEGGGHDVNSEDDTLASEMVADAGYEFEHTFEEGDDVTLYKCTPHVTMEMKGAVVVGDAADDAPSTDAPAASTGLQSIPMVPGVVASLGIIGMVTVAVSKWAGATQDETRVRR